MRSPRFIYFGMSSTVETGSDQEVEQNAETLQDKIIEENNRKDRRKDTRDRIRNDLSKFNCAICFTKTETLHDNPLCILPCGHAYHASCTVQLLLKIPEEHKCPLCRHKIENDREIEFVS